MVLNVGFTFWADAEFLSHKSIFFIKGLCIHVGLERIQPQVLWISASCKFQKRLSNATPLIIRMNVQLVNEFIFHGHESSRTMVDFRNPDMILFQDLITEVILVFIKIMSRVRLSVGKQFFMRPATGWSPHRNPQHDIHGSKSYAPSEKPDNSNIKKLSQMVGTAHLAQLMNTYYRDLVAVSAFTIAVAAGPVAGNHFHCFGNHHLRRHLDDLHVDGRY